MFESKSDNAPESRILQSSYVPSIFSESALQESMPVQIEPLKFKADGMAIFGTMPVDSMAIGVDYRLAS